MFPRKHPDFELHITTIGPNGKLINQCTASATLRAGGVVDLSFPPNDRHPCPPVDTIPSAAIPTKGAISGFKRADGSVDYLTNQ